MKDSKWTYKKRRNNVPQQFYLINEAIKYKKSQLFDIFLFQWKNTSNIDKNKVRNLNARDRNEIKNEGKQENLSFMTEFPLLVLVELEKIITKEK